MKIRIDIEFRKPILVYTTDHFMTLGTAFTSKGAKKIGSTCYSDPVICGSPVYVHRFPISISVRRFVRYE